MASAMVLMSGCNHQVKETSVTVPVEETALVKEIKPEVAKEQEVIKEQEPIVEVPVLSAEEKQEILLHSDTLAKGYFYEEAIGYLEEQEVQYPNADFKGTIEGYRQQAQKVVLYEGDIRNIFFHSLIVYPELAFDGGKFEKNYNMWMTTVDEYNKMLEEMYKRNFILIDVKDMYSQETVDGAVVIKEKPLYLPEGKKALLLSLDDLNYYTYMEKDGFADRLVLDEEGRVANLTKQPDGTMIVTRNHDCVPILDQFVEKHPDFSYRGAKGVIGITGFEGVYGYRTDRLDSETYVEDVEAVKSITAKLKETGWHIASHSYGHINMPKVSLHKVQRDATQWSEEVGSIVGETDLFIYPYGSTVGPSSKKFQVLKDQGFHVAFGVGSYTAKLYRNNMLLMNRVNLDGFKMKKGPNQIKDLFDPQEVLDPNRPPLH